MNSAEVLTFQETVWDYYQKHGRQLPWRQAEADGSFDPYKILVSEIMLQQTQVNRVTPKFQAFLKQFPDLGTLAAASLGDVLIAWSGLGYNRRAKYLHDAAKQLVSKNRPWKLEDLTACKGIGQNTAVAVNVYAYNQPQVFIETNIRTVYIHHFFTSLAIGSHPIADQEMKPLVEQTLDHENPREFYWALMDYGTHLKTSVGNAARRSQHHTKQSSFEGSRRQIRGRVLRSLILKPMTLTDLQQVINDKRLSEIVSQLETEQLIRRGNYHYSLAN